MALQSQGVIIRRSSTVAGTTAGKTTNTWGFSAAATAITRQAGFAGFDVGMRIESNASLNTGAWTVKGGTDGTALTVHEPLTVQASGATVILEAHTMATIGQIVSFNGPALTANVIDVTNLQSTAKEKLISIYDGGNISLSVNLDTTVAADLHLSLMDDLKTRTLRKFDIKFTDTGTSQPSAVYFGGYVAGFGITGSVDNALKADISFAVSTGINFIRAV